MSGEDKKREKKQRGAFVLPCLNVGWRLTSVLLTPENKHGEGDDEPLTQQDVLKNVGECGTQGVGCCAWRWLVFLVCGTEAQMGPLARSIDLAKAKVDRLEVVELKDATWEKLFNAAIEELKALRQKEDRLIQKGEAEAGRQHQREMLLLMHQHQSNQQLPHDLGSLVFGQAWVSGLAQGLLLGLPVQPARNIAEKSTASTSPQLRVGSVSRTPLPSALRSSKSARSSNSSVTPAAVQSTPVTPRQVRFAPTTKSAGSSPDPKSPKIVRPVSPLSSLVFGQPVLATASANPQVGFQVEGATWAEGIGQASLGSSGGGAHSRK
jgi:hypothetical protein